MDGCSIAEIRRERPRERARWQALLVQAGIGEDPHLEHVLGLFDAEDRLLATGACFGSTLRCLAVDADYRGGGLLAPIVTALTEYQFAHGRTHLFVYTKCDTAPFFRSLGYREIARVPEKAVFMENRADGFAGYLAGLAPGSGKQAAVVMNANPFTLGHRYLIEQAKAHSDTLHLFLVSEDASEFPFPVRKRLVQAGVADIAGIVLHETGDYLISRATFPSYFFKEASDAAAVQARLDAHVFLRIARALGIAARFVGTEPFSPVTDAYNRALLHTLPPQGVACHVVPRFMVGGEAVSASRVRALLAAGALDGVRALVPESTWAYLNETGNREEGRRP